MTLDQLKECIQDKTQLLIRGDLVTYIGYTDLQICYKEGSIFRTEPTVNLTHVDLASDSCPFKAYESIFIPATFLALVDKNTYKVKIGKNVCNINRKLVKVFSAN